MGSSHPLPFGVVPTVPALNVTAFECAFHADDVRTSLVDDHGLAPDVAAAFVGFMPIIGAMLAGLAEPGEPSCAYDLVAASGRVRLVPTGGSDELPTCEVVGDDIAIALFTMGRLPATDPRLTVGGEAAGSLEEFKRWFVGP